MGKALIAKVSEPANFPSRLAVSRQAITTSFSAQDLPIGVFDSGVGGLTVLKALQRQLPQESFVYFGDTARVPYGTRSQAEILTFAREILTWMAHYPVKMAIMACNTSSALALDIVRSEFDLPILGVILPGARAAVRQGQRIGVIATPATVASGSYEQAILEINPTVHVHQVGCPEFVPLIEANQIEQPQTFETVRSRLAPLIEDEIDTLIYGCTHYPHLESVIHPLLPASVHHVNPAIHIARAAAQELELLNLKTHLHRPTNQFYVSGDPAYFAHLSQRWLGFLPTVAPLVLPSVEVEVPEESVENVLM
ncbi:glutamate racemase [Synechococcales cyanobacterium C]|uniref:Glutamate racemase n=2 Tax=Petrachloros TaxID=2918834 RepID=A0A8K2A6P3_9CYAN|nr:glutamate racemase [Petrachloros mirabilis ULC683]